MTKGKRELPLIRRRIEALLLKTVANGCTHAEAVAAFEKAKQLCAQYGIDHELFRWPQKPSAPSGSATSGERPKKPPRAAGSSRDKGIGRMAERLIVERPDMSHAAIAAEVNRMITGARATPKSIRWYASRMRRKGLDVPSRRGRSR